MKNIWNYEVFCHVGFLKTWRNVQNSKWLSGRAAMGLGSSVPLSWCPALGGHLRGAHPLHQASPWRSAVPLACSSLPVGGFTGYWIGIRAKNSLTWVQFGSHGWSLVCYTVLSLKASTLMNQRLSKGTVFEKKIGGSEGVWEDQDVGKPSKTQSGSRAGLPWA